MVGMALCATWLWCCWCQFPTHHLLNDMRVAASVGLHRGFSPYSTAGTGLATTWIYGPVPLYLLWPAGWARTAAGALEVAGALSLGLVVLGVAVGCASIRGPRSSRLAAALVTLLVWPHFSLVLFSAEHAVVALGLVGTVLMSRGRGNGAALCAALALASKQTALGIGLAQVTWLLFVIGPREAARHFGRWALFSGALALTFWITFGFAGLWHTAVEVPSRLPWTAASDLWGHAESHHTYLLSCVGLPCMGFVCWRRLFWRRTSPLLLPSLTYVFLMPLALATFFKIGGAVSALEVVFVWVTPVLAVLAASLARLSRWAALAGALTIVALASWRLAAPLPVKPDTEAYREADYLARRAPGACWFPLNPLVTLYSEGAVLP